MYLEDIHCLNGSACGFSTVGKPESIPLPVNPYRVIVQQGRRHRRENSFHFLHFQALKDNTVLFCRNKSRREHGSTKHAVKQLRPQEMDTGDGLFRIYTKQPSDLSTSVSLDQVQWRERHIHCAHRRIVPHYSSTGNRRIPPARSVRV